MKIYVMRWQVHMLLPFYTNHLRFYYRMCVCVCVANSFILLRRKLKIYPVQVYFCLNCCYCCCCYFCWDFISNTPLSVGSIMWACEPNSSRIHIFAAHKKRDKRENWSLKSRAHARLLESLFCQRRFAPERPFRRRHFAMSTRVAMNVLM